MVGAATTAHAADNAPPLQRPRALSLTPSETPAPAQSEDPPATQPTEAVAAKPSPEVAPNSVEPPPPTPRASAAPSSEPGAGDVAIKKESKPNDKKKKLAHRGLSLGANIGTQGCLRSLCGSGSHNASPGVRLDGFIGGNIRGFVELGVDGGWGTMGAEVEEGTNVLNLYGVNPVQLQQMAVLLGRPLDFNVFALGVNDTQLRMARVGPKLRIHFIPRGRVLAYVGTGVGYSRFRAKYKTNGGDVRVDLHGLDVPIEIGGGAQITKHFGVTAQFNYFWTKYPLATLDHPDQELTLPVRVLDEVAAMQGGNVSKGLPQYWSVTLGARFRL